MDTPPFARHQTLRKGAERLCVLSVHPPAAKRGWMVTVLTQEGRAYLVDATELKEGGWTAVDRSSVM